MKPSFVRSQKALLSAVALSLALTATSCSDDEEMTGTELPECDSSVTISVTPGTSPIFTWTPECTVFSLGVELTNTDEDQWVIVSDAGDNTIEPGVEYGQVPPGASQAAEARILMSGEAYTVVVIRLFGEDQILAGFTEFVP